MYQPISRRSLFRLAGGAAAVAVGGPLVSACGSGAKTTNDPTANAKVVLPKHIPYRGVTPDMPAEPVGVMPGFLRYPKKPVNGVPEKAGSGEELTAFIAQIRPVPPAMDKNEYWQNINDNLGLTLKLQMVPSPDYADKLATLLAGGELPDFTMITSTPRLPDLLAAKFQDLTEYVSGDAIKDYPMLANIREEQWRQMVYNGGIYGVPIPREPVGSIGYIRKDIIDAKGLNPGPATFAEFKELAAGLTDGAHSQWAFFSPTGVQAFIQRMMGAQPGWTEENGKFTTESELESTREALSRARELVEAGYFHPDWAIDDPPFKEWFGAGTVAFVNDNYSAWPGYIMLYKGQNPDMDLDGMVPPKYDASSTPNIARGAPTFSITAFKKTDDAEHIKLMLRVCNYLAAPFGTEEYLANRYGVEGVHFEYNDDGDPILNDKGTVETTAEFYRVADAPWALYEPGHPEETRKEHAYQVKALPLTVPSKATGLYSETNSAKGGTIGELLTTTQKEILKGRKGLSDWDDAVQKWPDLPGTAEGVMPAFFTYPANPVDAIAEKPGRGGELTAFVATYEALPVVMDKNTMWQKINEELGVTMKMQIIPSTDFEDKQNTLVASGDLPDFTMLSYSTPRLPQLLGAKFQDLTEFLSGDAVKDYPMLAQMGDERWKTCIFNGGIYGLPIPRDVVGGVLYVRVDICKEKGLNPQPETFDDFKQLADDLTDESKSKWAFGQPTAIQGRIQRMMGAPVGWKDEGGKLTSENELETTKEAMAKTRELVEAGYFHPDWAIEAPPVKDWIAAGTVAILEDNYTAWPGYVKIYLPQYPEMELDGMLPPKYDSSSTPNIARGGPSFSITALKQTDDKEKIKEMLRVANFLAAAFGTQEHLLVKFGVEGVDHERVDGEPQLTDKGLREQGLNLSRIADAPFGLYEAGHPEITKVEHAYQVKAVPLTMKNPTTGLYSETNTTKGSVLGDILANTQKEILQGRKDVDDWDDAVQKWREQGGDQVRSEFEEALAAAKDQGTN